MPLVKMGEVYFVSDGYQVSVARVGGKSLLTLMSSRLTRLFPLNYLKRVNLTSQDSEPCRYLFNFIRKNTNEAKYKEA